MGPVEQIEPVVRTGREAEAAALRGGAAPLAWRSLRSAFDRHLDWDCFRQEQVLNLELGWTGRMRMRGERTQHCEERARTFQHLGQYPRVPGAGLWVQWRC